MTTRWIGAGLLMIAVFAAASLAPASVTSQVDPMSVLLANSPAPVRNLLQRGLMEVHEYQIDLPPGTIPSLSVDWATGRISAAAVPFVDQNEAHALGSGCTLNTGFTFGNVINPLGVDLTCTVQSHTTPIALSTLTCTVTVFCFTEVINFDFLNFGLFELGCFAPGGVASWSPGGGVTATGTCLAFLFGAAPNTYNLWEGFVGKESAGPAAVGFHLD